MYMLVANSPHGNTLLPLVANSIEEAEKLLKRVPAHPLVKTFNVLEVPFNIVKTIQIGTIILPGGSPD
jgi:hypothetical protein